MGYRFNTVGVSDGISMGTDGMSYSLQSRDIIADSIETTMGGQVLDIKLYICIYHSKTTFYDEYNTISYVLSTSLPRPTWSCSGMTP